MSKLLSLSDAASRLNTSGANLRGAIARGSLKATKVGRDWLVDEREVERYAAENRRGQAPAGEPA